jgi:F420-non-reducing hydrogenase iron-sulfur subunit
MGTVKSEARSQKSEVRTAGTGQAFEPRIVGFLCNWCTYAGADLAGTSRLQYPANMRAIRVMCSGSVEPSLVLEAFRDGADAVFIGGCHPGDCHYQSGNYKTLKRTMMLKRLMQQLGIEEGRLRLEWISAAEGAKFAQVVREYTDQMRSLGPLGARPEVRSPKSEIGRHNGG